MENTDMNNEIEQQQNKNEIIYETISYQNQEQTQTKTKLLKNYLLTD